VTSDTSTVSRSTPSDPIPQRGTQTPPAAAAPYPGEVAPVVADPEEVMVAPAAPGPQAPAGAVAQHPPRGRFWTAKFVLLLGFMVALGAFTTDMYLPSLPEVGRDLGATPSAVHFTISATLIGGALGQFVIGPLSDRYGRRMPVLIGITVHVLASVACMLAYDVAPLIALRIIQGIGNAAAAVVAMAVIRDRLSGSDASAVLSRLMLVIGLAPLLAPTIGGALASVWDWRAVFAALALYGVGLFLIVWRFLPETLPPARRLQGSPLAVLGTYRVLLRDRTFVSLALLPGLGMSAVFAYVSASPYVIREAFGLTENQFALLFALNGIGIVIGAQVNAALVRRFTPIRLVRLALPISLTISVVLLTITLFDVGGLVALMVPLGLLMGVNAFVMPNASATALSRHGQRAGGAAALIGVSQFGVAGLIAPLVGIFGVSATSMAGVICGAMILALSVLALGTPAYRRGGWAFEAG